MTDHNPFDLVDTMRKIGRLEREVASQDGALTNIHHIMRNGAKKAIAQITGSAEWSAVDTLETMINIADEWDRHHG